jgi:hypothetical protein
LCFGFVFGFWFLVFICLNCHGWQHDIVPSASASASASASVLEPVLIPLTRGAVMTADMDDPILLAGPLLVAKDF